ncbi:hypothetical protein NL529_31775, partial [Klebsiella pneumoniae]|nr:hypothetical protein [Klebsiella pneumoniae]
MTEASIVAKNDTFNNLNIEGTVHMHNSSGRTSLVSQLLGLTRGVSFCQTAGSNNIASGAAGQAITTYAAPSK